MNEKIMSDLSEYIAAYTRYISSVSKKSLTGKLTKVYNELLEIAEKNADDYDKFIKACRDKKIYDRFQVEIEKCKKVFNKLISDAPSRIK
jgi:hypothetical protein